MIFEIMSIGTINRIGVMKFRMMSILLVLFAGVASQAFAATRAVSVRVKVSSTNGRDICGYNWNGGVQPVFERINRDENTIEVIFQATWNLSNSSFEFAVYPCDGQQPWRLQIYLPTSETCLFNTFESSDFVLEGQSYYSPMMTAETQDVTCNTARLHSSCTVGNTVWEVSQTPSDPASWKIVRNNPGMFYLGDYAYITDDDLRSVGLDPYATTSARARDVLPLTPQDHDWSGIYERTTNVVEFKLFAPPPTASVVGHTDVVCKGQTNGTVTLRVSHPTVGEIDHFVVNCKNRNTGQLIAIPDGIVTGDNLITDLGAGLWEFEVINNVNKPRYGVCSTTPTYTVIEPDVVSIRFESPLFNTYAIRCHGGTGQVTAIGQGGVGGYKDFQWTGGPAGDTYTARPAGTYTVSLKDARNCPATASVTLYQPNPLQITLTAPLKYNGYPVRCLNQNNGELNAAVTGGAGGYSYSWTNHSSTTNTATNLSANLLYTVTVTDGNTCSAIGSKTLDAPLPIDFNLNTVTGLTCPGDQTASFNVTGVKNTIGDVAYTWTPSGSGTSIINQGAGTYTVTVSDEQGCSTLKSVTLIDPPAYTVSLDPLLQYHGSAIKCAGDDSGELTTTVKDAMGAVVVPQNYRWTRNAVLIGESPSLTAMSGVNSGIYKVVITYNGQCEAEDTYTLLDPPALRATIKVEKLIKCHNESNASLKLESSGGIGGPAAYTYRWSTGATTTTVLTDLPAGGYGVKLWDVNGCLARDTVTLENPQQVEARIVSFSNYATYGVSCAGKSDGFITAEGIGGTGVYSYAWSNGMTGESISNLPANTNPYVVTVSDENLCPASIGHVITSPAPLTLQSDQSLKKNVRCFGGSDGSVVLLAQGGAGNNKYSKDNTRWRQLEKFDTLAVGDYIFYVRDGNGCSNSVSEKLTEPAKIEIGFTGVEPAFCSNPVGKATGVVNGGVGIYRYEWRRNNEGAVLSTDVTLSGVPAGNYRLLVNDGNGCAMEEGVPITSTDGATATYTAADTRCHDTADGSAAISIDAGEGPFKILWPGKETTGQVTGLAGGTYNVEITDVRGCMVILPVTVESPTPLGLDVTEKLPTCNKSCDGELTLQAKGGVGNYAYAWNGQTAAAQTQLCAAQYTVVVSDANGCSLSTDVELRQPEPIGVAVTRQTLATCRDGCDGTLEVGAAGGNGGYQYTWMGGGSTPVKDNLCPGSYVVDVVDSKGCTGQGTVILNNTDPLPLDLGGGITLCVGQAHRLDAGPGWIQTRWGSNTGFTSAAQQVTVKDPGSYWVDVLSSKGCIARDTFLLETSFDLLKASFMMASEAVVGDTVVMIDISWPLPESIAWNFPLAMKEVLNLGDAVFGQFAEAGAYDVGLTAHLGECVDQVTKTITILSDDGDSSGGKLGYEAFVKHFQLLPNPNDGSFEVGVELAEESAVTLSVWRSENGVLVGKIGDEGADSYKMFFDLRPLSSGLYVLRLDHAKGKEYIRFIVH